ncbi:ABC-three component system protein [Sinorhizobium fredii]|uniref:ABC-three component system protein n=1 Tax=Rhizobium fredii TaxID=380 RepID=UPI0035153330
MSVDEYPKLKTSVPGQYLGYGLQPVRLCYHLMSVGTGCRVSLEQLDDIAIHDPSGGLVFEQSKSALSGNPAADKSPELWKTLANWASLPTSLLDAATAFRFYVTPFKTGNLVHELHDAKDGVKAASLLKKFKTKTFKGKKGVGVEPLISKFLGGGDEACLKVITLFELQTEQDPIDAIRQKLLVTLPEESLDQYCAAAIGIAKDDVDSLIRTRKAPILDAVAFRRKLRAFIRKHDFSKLLASTTGAPSPDQIAVLLNSQPTFVRQLMAVEAKDALMTVAISDFLRATADKVIWADRGSIVDSSLDELDESLIRHHTMAADELSDTHAHLDAHQRGRQLYHRCANLKMPLEGQTLPGYFVAGEYNCLADDRKVGWHPDYESLFPKGKS